MEENDGLQIVTNAASSAAEETVGKLMQKVHSVISNLVTWENLFKVIGAIIVILCIYFIYKMILKGINKIPGNKFGLNNFLVKKLISYIFYILVILYILSLFNVNLSAIWGAAGIAGVAIGFAAQTSFSNIISGLFILTEKNIKVGDFICVDGESGTVDSMGLLSVKIHTTDNQMIRIPNSTIISSFLKNNNYFDVRRMTFKLSISYDDDMEKALEALKKVPEKCETVLKDPAFAVWYDGFGDSGINVNLAVWFKNSDLIQVKNEVYINIKKVFDEEKINIPYNRLDVSLLK